MTKLKLGVLGVSDHFITRVLQPLKESGLVDLYAIASRSPDRAREASRKFGIPRYYSSYEELLKDDEIGMVFIPLPNHLHAEWIRKAADARKHILCEKPIALNAGEAKRAAGYARSRGVKLMEAFMYRFHYQWTMARDMVTNGSLGKIQSIETFFGYNNTDPGNIRNIKAYGGGALLDIGCYAASCARFLLQAEPDRVLGLNTYDRDFKTDILSSGILDFKGIRSVFTVSTQTTPWQKVIVHGNSAVLTIEIPFNPIPDTPMKLDITDASGSRIIETEPCDHYRLQFDAFAKAVIENTDVPIPAADAVNNMKVIDALFKSGKTGKWVKI